MATQAPSLESKPGTRKDVLGRSAATGKFVLKPASRPGRVSDAEVRDAVRAVIRQRESRSDKITGEKIKA